MKRGVRDDESVRPERKEAEMILGIAIGLTIGFIAGAWVMGRLMIKYYRG